MFNFHFSFLFFLFFFPLFLFSSFLPPLTPHSLPTAPTYLTLLNVYYSNFTPYPHPSYHSIMKF
jgi:hypothetical protein